MADAFADAAAWAFARLKETAPRQVVYRRGAQSVALTVVVGNSLLKLSDRQGGTRVERVERDYLVAVEDLILGGVAVKPQREDRVEDATDGRVYEVSAPLPEPPWRYSDPRRTVYRIHTKDVDTL